MLQGINDTLVDRLAENVKLSMTQALSPVADSMDRFILGATRNQIDGVNRIVSRFLDEMDRSMGNQFSSLAQAMDAVTQNQVAAAHQTGSALSSAEGIVRNAQSLQEMTGGILRKFDTYMADINAHKTRDEGFEKRTADLLSHLQQQNRELSTLISSLKAAMEALPKQDGSALTDIRDLTSALNDQVSTIASSLSALKEA